MSLSEQSIKQALSQLVFAELGSDIVTSNWLKSVEITEQTVNLMIRVGFPCENYQQHYIDAIKSQLAELTDLPITVDFAWSVAAHTHKAGVPALKGVKNIIAIASGKGGVGKSTTSTNLALALQSEGARVGILDGDIYGPSQPLMLGTADARPETIDSKTIKPVEQYGLQSMSIGYLVDPEQAMVWRGPMASSALQQIINDTQWQDLDYLIVDLPPGTGDIQLTLSQKVPVTAAVIVTTPQNIALADAVKGVNMFKKVAVPVLGVIENMGIHICSNCGHAEHIFGEGGGQRLAEDESVEYLGSLPLSKNIRDYSDKGEPIMVAEPDGKIADIYKSIARTMAARLSLHAKDYGQSLPNITISND
ncbi:MAG: iron-sulfur cluster carrier protein ApbC [Kangiellaceae bacterium]|jgi:ATP-binding protein involved in chromosome partitioning|nr:iron-sulfur cluster carrier protein ApbC [Kangiellaceae bacterium]